MKDFRGNEIKVGDTVIYPGRSGSTCWMNQAVVLEIQEGQGDRWRRRLSLFDDPDDTRVELRYIPSRLTVRKPDSSRVSRIERIDRVAVVPE